METVEPCYWSYEATLEPPPQPIVRPPGSPKVLQSLDPQVVQKFYKAIQQHGAALMVPTAWACNSPIAPIDFSAIFRGLELESDHRVEERSGRINFLQRWEVWQRQEAPQKAEIGPNVWQKLAFPTFCFPGVECKASMGEYDEVTKEGGKVKHFKVSLYICQCETTSDRRFHFEDVFGRPKSFEGLRALQEHAPTRIQIYQNLFTLLIEKYTEAFSEVQKRLYRLIILIQLDLIRYQRYPHSYRRLLGSLGIHWDPKAETRDDESPLAKLWGEISGKEHSPTEHETYRLYACAMSAVLSACDRYLVVMRNFVTRRLRSSFSIIEVLFSAVGAGSESLDSESMLQSLDAIEGTSYTGPYVPVDIAEVPAEMGGGRQRGTDSPDKPAPTQPENIESAIEAGKKSMRTRKRRQLRQAKAARLAEAGEKEEPVIVKDDPNLTILGKKRDRLAGPLDEDRQTKKPKVYSTPGADL
ncbi:MAG: hypothetical protein M1814_000240 [Vezdaea aestivalis]|nr:MAG: hypothetical protein M1814_000240 [Vezdaea aestivalis]